MQNARHSISIELLEFVNPKDMDAAFFIDPAIALMESYRHSSFPFDVICERITSSLLDNTNTAFIEIHWRVGAYPDSKRLLLTLQRPVIVEYAAVAVAFLLVTQIANCAVTEVTMRGDKADYFLNDRKLMLEISGTEDAKQLTTRHKQKRSQLLANPYGKGGFVVVCCFSNQKTHFSFHPERRRTY